MKIKKEKTTSMSSYTYQSITSWTNTIRLFRLVRHPPKQAYGPIYGELFKAELQDEQSITYEALSYTWGDSTKIAEVIIDGQKVAVTVNLYDALLHLRNAGEDRILWVDALCINQQDNYERTHQVAKMSFIYQKAQGVIIWLGKTTYEIDQLFKATRRLDKSVQKRPRPSDDAERRKVWIEEGRQIMGSWNWDWYWEGEILRVGLQDLLDRSWFRRVWVVQEAANAKAAQIQCSWSTAPARAFVMLPIILEQNANVHSQALLDVLPGPLRQSSWWHDDRSLSTILHKFRGSQHAKDGQPFLPNYEFNMLECIQKTVFFLVFSEIPSSVAFSLPAWSLEEFYANLPSLVPALLKWAIDQGDNGIPLVRKLLNEAPYLSVNEPLAQYGSSPNSHIRIMDLRPLPYLISSAKSIETIRIFLERDDLDSRQISDGLLCAALKDNADAMHALLKQEKALGTEVILPILQASIQNRCSSATTEMLFFVTSHSLKGVQKLNMVPLLRLAVESENGSAIAMLVRSGVHPDTILDGHENTAMIIAINHEFKEIRYNTSDNRYQPWI
ncbi:HET domain-containing protein [Colletotrichum asianum]|uniref:HET domain-containing protein n=1 Tax=Colletotrichum asianum TaxID=702518 RepID=A0A8H3WRW4_9PEZI|nr:HET domain-containing protein [Colletotrichum asianum]